MRVLGVVPARGGSKGVPGKNIRLLCGRPLLAYTAHAALGATSLTRVVLSTEDERIAEVGEQFGLEVAFRRPRELSMDDTPMLPVVQHAVAKLEAAGDRFDAVCLLQPTSPLRTAADIDACVTLLSSSGADGVVTVLPVPAEFNPHWVYYRGEDGVLRLSTGATAPIPRRQELPQAWHREGSVYVTRRAVLMQRGSLYGDRLVGYEMKSACVNIDAPADWDRAETLLRERSRLTRENGAVSSGRRTRVDAGESNASADNGALRR